MPQYKYAPAEVFDRLPHPKPGIAYVYGLRQMDDSEYRYVGSTVNPRTRLTGHYHTANKSELTYNDELSNWLNENRHNIEMDILWSGPKAQRLKHEKDIANRQSRKGARLFNMRRPTKSLTNEDRQRRAVWRDLLGKILDK